MARCGRSLKQCGVLILAATTGFHFATTSALLVDAAVGEEEFARVSRSRDAVRTRVQDGILVQEGCAQAVSGKEAQARQENDSLPGGLLVLDSLDIIGRSGNHFVTISAFFSMAFCCKSKTLGIVLPGQANAFPQADDGREPNNGAAAEAGRRWFDFSPYSTDPAEGPLPHLPEFEDLAGRPDVCPPYKRFSGADGFFLGGVHPDLTRCIKRVFVRGCEADYLRSVVDSGLPSCPLAPPPAEEEEEEDDEHEDDEDEHYEEGAGEDEAVAREQADLAERAGDTGLIGVAAGRPRSSRCDWGDQGFVPARDGLAERGGGGGGGGGQQAVADAGPLVIHLRRGDIFKAGSRGSPQYGQPPLHFYLSVLVSHDWSSVSIITSAGRGYLNPAFKALKQLATQGLLGPNVETFQDRSFRTDLEALLCAENLVVARSSLAFVALGHSRARRLFLPTACGPGAYHREDHSGVSGTTAGPDNFTLLCLQRPDAEVYGIEWNKSADEYSVYKSWDVSEAQLLEMVLTDEVKGVKRCCV